MVYVVMLKTFQQLHKTSGITLGFYVDGPKADQAPSGSQGAMPKMDLTELKHLQRLILRPILLTVHLVLIYTLIKELIAL